MLAFRAPRIAESHPALYLAIFPVIGEEPRNRATETASRKTTCRMRTALGAGRRCHLRLLRTRIGFERHKSQKKKNRPRSPVGRSSSEAYPQTHAAQCLYCFDVDALADNVMMTLLCDAAVTRQTIAASCMRVTGAKSPTKEISGVSQ